MSISSIANPSNTYAYPLVLQQGNLTQATANPITVACASILATDQVLLQLETLTAPAPLVVGTAIYRVVITAGTGFVATPLDNTYRGVLGYVVLRSTAQVVNATSPA
jgi:hypothetical protein